MRDMEFNVNASDAGARLRTGVGTHTLSIGGHDVTLMINGSRVELMTLALAIADQAGLKIQLDGHINGNAAYVKLYDEHMEFHAEMQRLRARLASDAQGAPMPKVWES